MPYRVWSVPSDAAPTHSFPVWSFRHSSPCLAHPVPVPAPPWRSCVRAVQRSDEIAAEKNRALKAALNAELRKTKAMLLEAAIPLLEKMARKGKGLPAEVVQARLQQVGGCVGAWVGGCAQAPHACEQVGRAVVGSGRRAGRPLMCVPVPLTSALLLLLLLLDRRWRSCGRR